jgi:hypothetical protein
MTRTLALALCLAITPLAASHAADEPGEKLTDYSCWALMTEAEESAGYSEVFYLGYALGRSGVELADEQAYKRVVAAVIERCQREPNTRVLDAFGDALKQP